MVGSADVNTLATSVSQAAAVIPNVGTRARFSPTFTTNAPATILAAVRGRSTRTVGISTQPGKPATSAHRRIRKAPAAGAYVGPNTNVSTRPPTTIPPAASGSAARHSQAADRSTNSPSACMPTLDRWEIVRYTESR